MVGFCTNYEAKAILLLGLALLSYGAEGASSYGRRGLVDTGATTVFDVTKYGAKADGTTDNAMAFIRTFVAACKNSTGPAKVVIPKGTFMAGPTIFQGPCTTPGPIVIEVQGTVKANTDISEYPDPQWFGFEYIDGLILNGGGTFDGQGADSWGHNDCKGNRKGCQLLPTSLYLHRVNNSVIENINSVNSKGFHMFLTFCEKSTIHDINLTAPDESPNTDGIHLSGSNLINITNSVIGTGDDCVSIGQGSTNVSVTGITCGPGHGISIGSLGKYPDEKDVRGIFVKNCTLTNTTNGVRIKTWGGSKSSQASGIFFEDLIMNDVKNPIIIDQNYGSKKSKASSVKISDVHYKNIKGTSQSVNPVNLMCSELAPCDDIEMLDIDLSFSGSFIKKGLSFGSACLHASIVFGGKQNPPACLL